MRRKTRHFSTDLAIIGTGLAGFAASVFATNLGISCALVGNTGAVAYTTGYLDLLGCINTRSIRDPWGEIQRLHENNANHPLAGISRQDILSSFTKFTSFLSKSGIAYTSPGTENLTALTPVGTLKPTLCLPVTMEKGVIAQRNKAPCTVIGFHGLKGFSAHQIRANLREKWPSLEAKLVSFPHHKSGELYAEVAARSLEVSQNRIFLAKIIKEEAGGHKFVGLPAILGVHNPDRIHAELEKLTGISLFEIPTMPPSVPGIRLREMFEQVFPQMGVTLVPQQKAEKVKFSSNEITLELSDNFGQIKIAAKTAILATGRFLSGGLLADIDHVFEPLIGLPVIQPQSRKGWFRREYMDKRGHNIHLAGIETDSEFRPLGPDGKIYDKRLFGAGIVLAHQDWIRQRCGAGVAIATAYQAVEAAQRLLQS